MALKTCRSCEVEKDVSAFDKNPTGTFGVRGTCKECRRSNKERTRRYNIKAKYGITLEQFLEMYDEQDGRCKICSSEIEMYATRDKVHDVANIDHCHETGRIRGLLCNFCNTALGKFKDSPELLIKAAEYIRNYR